MNTKIRELKYSDRLKLSAMVRKLTEKLEDDSLLKLVSSSNTKQADSKDDNEDNFIKIGVNLFKLLIEFLEDDLAIWFADLLEVDIADFKLNAPFDIEIIVLDQLLEDKGKFKSFLAGASMLYSRIIGLKNRLSTMREK